MNSDPFNFQRFVDAQNHVYDEVRSELQLGHKTSHWMWFIFPQIQGLGLSPMATHFAISSLEEARAYLNHSLLGGRLRECTSLVTQVRHRTLLQIFGSPDDMKFRSSMTLFAHATTGDNVFDQALKHFGIEYDPMTLERL